MATVSCDKIITTGKSLVGADSDKSCCDIMKWYGIFSTAINSVACCCAGMMYLFNKAGALSMIPGGKTASCGQLAVNFYNAGQIYKPSDVKVGDLVIFSWSGDLTTYNTNLRSLGYKTFDHVELVIAVNSTTITTIGANNGGTECDDFQVKTRYKSNISACCRPKYTSVASSATTPTSTNNEVVPNVTYKVRTNNRWLPEVKNCDDFAGINGFAVTDVAIKVDKGSVKYRVHVKGGGWLPYVTGYDTSDYNNGYAGNGREIDAIEIIYYTDIAKNSKYYFATYRVSPVGKTYYDWQYDNITDANQDGYAGSFGKAFDRLQIKLTA